MSLMKKSVVIGLVVLGVFGLFLAASQKAMVEAADVQVIEAKVVPAAKIPTFDATAYIAGHGGHLAILNMNTMKPPTDIEKDRIVLAEAGSEMEGKIAGMSFEEVKKAGGSHGQAMMMEGGKKVLVAGTLAGNVYKIDLATGKKEVRSRLVRNSAAPLQDLTAMSISKTWPMAMSTCGMQKP